MKKALVFCLLVSSLYADAPPIQTKRDGGNSNALSAAYDTNVTADSILVVAVFQQDTGWTMTSGPSNSCGDTFTEAANSPITSANGRTRVYTTKTSGGCSSVLLGSSATAPYGTFLAEYGGMAGSGYVECDASGTGTGTSLATGNCVTTSNNTTIVSFAAMGSDSVTYTPGASFTMVDQQGGTGHSEALQNRNVTAAGTYTGTMTSDTSGAWTIHVMALKSATQSSSSTGSITMQSGTGSITTQSGTGTITSIQ